MLKTIQYRPTEFHVVANTCMKCNSTINEIIPNQIDYQHCVGVLIKLKCKIFILLIQGTHVDFQFSHSQYIEHKIRQQRNTPPVMFQPLIICGRSPPNITCERFTETVTSFNSTSKLTHHFISFYKSSQRGILFFIND